MKQRPYNFAAGPATLPIEVLEKIEEELFDWKGTGVSIMEIGHRTKLFQELLNNLQDKLRTLMHIPANYKVLFLPGGAQGQFANIPMNLVKYNQDVDYFISGVWSKRAATYAKSYARVNIVTEAANGSIPGRQEWQLNPKAAYVYYCPNETIDGIQFPLIPDVNNAVPLVADMTSSVLSFPFDINKFGIVLAAAQKNLGIAGVTLLIVRDDLLDQALDIVPNIWNFKLQAENNSGVNTPPVFPIYVMDLMVDWTLKQGGVTEISKINHNKVTKLYNYIDKSEFYINRVLPNYRSQVNVPFDFMKPDLLAKFLDEATLNGLKYLQGHILVGGARASLYNAMPMSGVDALINFMQEFAQNNR